MRLAGLIAAFAAGLATTLSADPRCLPCHSAQVKSYSNTGMGRSITRPEAEAATNSSFRHELSGTTFRAAGRSGSLQHEMSRGDRRAVYVPAWAIGSGNQGKSYLISVADALFQSPFSWYSARRTWDLSPGFADDKQPDFFRPVTADCLFCHAGSARPRKGTLNRYFDPPFQPASIGCDRCHGDPAAHLATAKNKIINPARLAPRLRDAVCEQCHLSGEARIPNPGKEFSGYRPGMPLEDIFSVYVKDGGDDPMGLKVVSHSEQMVRSRCFRESGQKMWCGTCHDPHQTPADKISWYRDKCAGCHAGQKAVTHRLRMGDDCVGCHMPRIRAYDGGHTAFHDHWIRRDRSETPARGSDRLRAWREPPEALRGRNLGLAYISAASRNGSNSQLVQGFNLLSSTPSDGAVETARGLVLLRIGNTGEAVAAFRRAVEEEPADSTRQLNLAAALLATGAHIAAKRHAEEAIALEPLLEDAYALLAEIEPGRALYWKNRYRKLVPQRALP